MIVREFTDPSCPYAFSAEPARLRLKWRYGDRIDWERASLDSASIPAKRGARRWDRIPPIAAIPARNGT